MFSSAPTRTLLTAYIIAALFGSFGLLYILHRVLGPRGRRWLIAMVTFVGGLFYGLEWYFPVHGHPAKNFLTDYIEPVSNMLAVVAAFTVGLGIYSLCQVHGRNVARQRPGWYNSLAFFIAMVAMFAFGLWEHYLHLPEPAPAVLPWPKVIYEVLFSGLFVPLQAATFSLLAFYIASAAYRAFRIRSAEAALMMAAAFIVMLGQVPIGAWLTNAIPHTPVLGFFRLEKLGEWVLRWLNTPAQRGILFGVAVGALAMSLRVWLSLERGTFFSEQS
ncbi:MAG: hypothetical protein ABSD48_04530 [Armatimonadota bacterium]|jgi:hypothetical protein